MPQKKKIIYVITKSFWGGAQRYVFDIATNLPKNEFDVLVVAGGNGLMIEKLKKEGVRVISLKSLSRNIGFFNEVFATFDLVRIFRKERPNIIHLNSSKILGIGALVGRIVRVPNIISTGHGWAFNEERASWQKFLIRIFVWLSLILTHKIICVSEKTKDDVAHFPFILKKIKVIENGIKRPDFLEKDQARKFLIEKLKIRNLRDKIWIGTISELHKNKGIDYIVKALALLKDLPFIFIIIGAGEEEKRLKETVEKEGIEDKVVFAGFVEDASRYLKAFDIFTLTSLTEALAYVLLEAGFAGLPVLASDTGGLPSIISNEDKGILVPPKDIEKIKNALEGLILNQELRETFGKNLKKSVQENFSFDKFLNKTLEFYR